MTGSTSLSSPPAAASWISQLARGYLGFALRTTRWSITGSEDAAALLKRTPGHETGTIVAFWHRSLLILPALWEWARRDTAGLKLNVLISRNRDGRLISDTVAPWGIIGIEGSSARKGKDKGGARAFRRAVATLRSGALLAITPDGPRGPAEHVHPGVLALARVTQAGIVPIGAACHALNLPSWDRLALPIPFGRGVLIHGQPLDNTADSESMKAALAAANLAARERHALGALSPAERGWGALGTLLAPFLIVMLRVRLARGKERETRLRERLGLTRVQRPPGRLLWIHAASVGECQSAMPLLDALLAGDDALTILMTTATITGADVFHQHIETLPAALAARLRHQFIPYDVPRWTRRFLNHWQPHSAIFVESELWPGLIAACFRRGISFSVVNARLSDRSTRRWSRFGGVARRMFARLTFVAARGVEDQERFAALGAPACTFLGDLKQSAPPLSVDPDEYSRLRHLLGDRPIFLAAATHAGEESAAAAAARLIRHHIPDLLCIIIPRHPVRAPEICAQLTAASTTEPMGQRTIPRRSLGDVPTQDDAIWLADTLGEMGLFYRLATVAWLGNSLHAPGGGHNPYEPIKLGVPLATGPHLTNFRPAFDRLAGTLEITPDADAMAAWATRLLQDPAKRASYADCATKALTFDNAVPAKLLTRLHAMIAS